MANLEKMIFAIDNDDDVHTVMRFYRKVSQLQARGSFGPMDQCIGSYKGVMERSYMIDARDAAYVVEFITGQESVLHVPADVRQPCTLHYNDMSRKPVSVGPMREVSSVDALSSDAWTYRNGKYYVCG